MAATSLSNILVSRLAHVPFANKELEGFMSNTAANKQGADRCFGFTFEDHTPQPSLFTVTSLNRKCNHVGRHLSYLLQAGRV